MSSWSSFEKDKVYTDQWRNFLTESDEAELILEHGVINENALQRFMNVMKGKIKVINKKLNDPVGKAVKDTQKLQDEIEELQDQIGRAKAQIEAQGAGADPASLRPLEQLVAQLEAKLENKRNPQQGQQQGQQGQEQNTKKDLKTLTKEWKIAVARTYESKSLKSFYQNYGKTLEVLKKIKPQESDFYAENYFYLKNFIEEFQGEDVNDHVPQLGDGRADYGSKLSEIFDLNTRSNAVRAVLYRLLKNSAGRGSEPTRTGGGEPEDTPTDDAPTDDAPAEAEPETVDNRNPEGDGVIYLLKPPRKDRGSKQEVSFSKQLRQVRGLTPQELQAIKDAFKQDFEAADFVVLESKRKAISLPNVVAAIEKIEDNSARDEVKQLFIDLLRRYELKASGKETQLGLRKGTPKKEEPSPDSETPVSDDEESDDEEPDDEEVEDERKISTQNIRKFRSLLRDENKKLKRSAMYDVLEALVTSVTNEEKKKKKKKPTQKINDRFSVLGVGNANIKNLKTLLKQTEREDEQKFEKLKFATISLSKLLGKNLRNSAVPILKQEIEKIKQSNSSDVNKESVIYDKIKLLAGIK